MCVEYLWRYSNKIESLGLRKYPYIITILQRKWWCHNNKHFSELAACVMAENSWHRFGMKKLRHCRSICPTTCSGMFLKVIRQLKGSGVQDLGVELPRSWSIFVTDTLYFETNCKEIKKNEENYIWVVCCWSIQPFGHNTPSSQTGQTEQDRQTGQWCDNIGRTILKIVAKKW